MSYAAMAAGLMMNNMGSNSSGGGSSEGSSNEEKALAQYVREGPSQDNGRNGNIFGDKVLDQYNAVMEVNIDLQREVMALRKEDKRLKDQYQRDLMYKEAWGEVIIDLIVEGKLKLSKLNDEHLQVIHDIFSKLLDKDFQKTLPAEKLKRNEIGIGIVARFGVLGKRNQETQYKIDIFNKKKNEDAEEYKQYLIDKRAQEEEQSREQGLSPS